MRLITVIAAILVATMFMAPEATQEKPLSRADKIRILCGENSSHSETRKPGEIQCQDKYGRKTARRILP